MNSQFRTTRIERDPMYNLECELKIRGFSRKTIKAYLHYNIKFLNFVRKSPKEIANEDVKRYLEYLANKQISNATLNLAINALKFYYTQILKRRFFFDIKYPKKEKRLPVVLTKEEIRKMLEVTKNLKHKNLALSENFHEMKNFLKKIVSNRVGYITERPKPVSQNTLLYP